MANSFLLSSTQLLALINSKGYMIGDIGLTKWDTLALVVEFFEYSSHYNCDVKEYLDSMWLLDDDVVDRVSVFIEAIIEDIRIFCPELTNVLNQHTRLYITQYDKHHFVLAKQERAC